MTYIDQYKVGKKIGNGNFGEIRKGHHADSGKYVAIKLEENSKKTSQLAEENKFYHTLLGDGSHIGIPEVYYYGTHGTRNVLVMELLGPSLEELFEKCGRRFSPVTVAETARQIINLLRFIHSRGIIHRDIKPENFLIGVLNSSRQDIIHVVDFGLSKEYIDPATNHHIPFREHKNLTGTARYMSINTHMGKEQSRRDDLEAVGHMLMYFLRGSLPWQGLKADNLRDRYTKIWEVKTNTKLEVLCDGFPSEFYTYLKYSRLLAFTADPDYDYLISLFDNFLEKNRSPGMLIFDWSNILKEEVDIRGRENVKSFIHSETVIHREKSKNKAKNQNQLFPYDKPGRNASKTILQANHNSNLARETSHGAYVNDDQQVLQLNEYNIAVPSVKPMKKKNCCCL